MSPFWLPRTCNVEQPAAPRHAFAYEGLIHPRHHLSHSYGEPFTVKDSDPNLEYRPRGGWKSFPPKFNITGTFPKVQGASVQLAFYGQDLSVTGHYFKGNDTLQYTLDSTLTSISVPSSPGTFSLSPALPCASHVIELQPQKGFIFQSMQYTQCGTASTLAQMPASFVPASSISSTPTASATSSAIAQDSLTSSRALRPGMIAGIVVGSVLFLVALVALLFFLWRRRLRRRQAHHPSAAYMASLEQTASNAGLFNYGATMYRSDTKNPLPATDGPSPSFWANEKQPAAQPSHGRHLPVSTDWPRRPDTALTNRTSSALEDDAGSRRSVILPPYPLFEAI